MRYSPQGRSKIRRAVAAVEAALALPPVLLFLAASVDLGRVGRIADALSNAARNGAQFATASTSAAANTAGIRAAALTEMAHLPNVSGTNPTITTTCPVTISGSTINFVTVTVTYNMSGTAVFGFFPVNSMTRTVTMPMMPQ